jgi:leucyl-tRNA synthetase
LAREEEIVYAVQINGKLRGHVTVAADSSKEAVQELALADEKIQAAIAGREIVKVIPVPGKLVNIVVK